MYNIKNSFRRSSGRFDLSIGLAYGLPVLPLYFLFGPITILQGIYAKYFGISLATIAVVLFVARLFDAIADPVIGYCADRYHDRYGNRKPFIVFGGVLFIISSWYLYVPPDNVSEEYFLVWFLIFYLGYTLFEIPHLAWGSDLTAESNDKNKVYGLRSFFMFLGSLFFFAIPLLPWSHGSEFTPETLKWSVFLAALLLLPLLLFGFRAVPNSSAKSNYIRNQSTQKKLNHLLLAIVTNKPLLTLSAAHIFSGLGWGMWLTILFLFVDVYLKLGEQFSLIYTISFSISILALGVWYQVAHFWGKATAWFSGLTLVLIGLIGNGVLVAGQSQWYSLLLCMTLILSGIAAYNIVVPSLLSDIVDYGTWKYGDDRAATYFSLYTFINKAVAALGGALGLAIASWFEFDPTANIQSEDTVLGLRLVVSWIPAIMICLSIAFVLKIPINARRHAIIIRRLNARSRRMAMKDLVYKSC